jgi:hypothetical protein
MQIMAETIAVRVLLQVLLWQDRVALFRPSSTVCFGARCVLILTLTMHLHFHACM